MIRTVSRVYAYARLSVDTQLWFLTKSRYFNAIFLGGFGAYPLRHILGSGVFGGLVIVSFLQMEFTEIVEGNISYIATFVGWYSNLFEFLLVMATSNFYVIFHFIKMLCSPCQFLCC